MNFTEYYEELPTSVDQKNFKKTVLEATKVHEMTFYKWLWQENRPQEKERNTFTHSKKETRT